MGFNPLAATTRRVSSGGGRGIISITFHSSSLGNVPALSGAIDTYKILREIDENLLKELRKQLRDGKIEWLEYKYAEEAAQAKYLLEKYAVCEEVET